MPDEIKQETDSKNFNRRTHYTDARGRITKIDHYRAHVREGTTYLERPINSGNLFFENNEPAGRVTVTRNAKGSIIGKKFEPDAEHIAFTPPLTGAARIEAENLALAEKNAKLQAELDAIKNERVPKQQPAKPTKE